MPTRPLLFVLAAAWCACSYLLPATWRAFRADPDDAAPSITRALAAQQLDVAKWEPGQARIVSEYIFMDDGVDRRRERFIITWERNESDGTLVIFVRHEAQEQASGTGRPSWGASSHDPAKETELLDAITEELQRQQQPLPTAP